MKLHDLRPAAGSRRERTRVGRGIAAGKGKTAGRGTKGQKARAGASIPPWFEGGQTPIHIRVPKLRGFKNRFKIVYAVVNVGQISEYAGGGPLRRRGRRQVAAHSQRRSARLSRPDRLRREAGQGARPGRRCAASSSWPPTSSARRRGARSRTRAVSSRSSPPRRPEADEAEEADESTDQKPAGKKRPGRRSRSSRARAGCRSRAGRPKPTSRRPASLRPAKTLPGERGIACHQGFRAPRPREETQTPVVEPSEDTAVQPLLGLRRSSAALRIKWVKSRADRQSPRNRKEGR